MPHYCWVRHILSVLSLAALIFGAFGASITGEAASAAGTTYYASSTPTSITCSISYPCSLQLAADKAADGDTIIAKTGTYYDTGAQVLYIDEDVTVQGGWNGGFGRGYEIDPVKYPTVLNGENARRVVLIDGNASPTLSGLTIREGFIAQGNGAGIAIFNHTGGSVTIDRCQIQENAADKYGGGLNILKGTVIIKESTIGMNSAKIGGGSIFASNESEVVLINNDISYNKAPSGSVGFFIEASIIAGANRIYANEGDAFSIEVRSGRTIDFKNNLVTENIGAVLNLESYTTGAFTFLHNTLWANEYGVIVGMNINGMIANNIFYEQQEESLRLEGGGNVTVKNNLFWDNGSNPVPGTSGVYADPKLDANFHLLHTSPAIEAGTPVGVWKDIDGHVRSVSLPDIGADEFMLSLYLPTTMR